MISILHFSFQRCNRSNITKLRYNQMTSIVSDPKILLANRVSDNYELYLLLNYSLKLQSITCNNIKKSVKIPLVV
jgi:hypothetical protein